MIIHGKPVSGPIWETERPCRPPKPKKKDEKKQPPVNYFEDEMFEI